MKGWASTTDATITVTCAGDGGDDDIANDVCVRNAQRRSVFGERASGLTISDTGTVNIAILDQVTNCRRVERSGWCDHLDRHLRAVCKRRQRARGNLASCGRRRRHEWRNCPRRHRAAPRRRGPLSTDVPAPLNSVLIPRCGIMVGNTIVGRLHHAADRLRTEAQGGRPADHLDLVGGRADRPARNGPRPDRTRHWRRCRPPGCARD